MTTPAAPMPMTPEEYKQAVELALDIHHRPQQPYEPVATKTETGLVCRALLHQSAELAKLRGREVSGDVHDQVAFICAEGLVAISHDYAKARKILQFLTSIGWGMPDRTTLSETIAWFDAMLNMVEGDGMPPNWDGLREHRALLRAMAGRE